MKNNAYVYEYNEFSQLLECIKSYDIIDIFISPSYEIYELIVSKKENSTNNIETIQIIIFKKFNIVAIITEKYKNIKNFNCNIQLKKINLLSKKIFKKIFKSNFSNNLTKLSVNINGIDSEEDVMEIIGTNLMSVDLLEELKIHDYNSNIEIKNYSIQPLKYKYLITFKSTNKIEFNKNYTIKEIHYLLNYLVEMFSGGINNERKE